MYAAVIMTQFSLSLLQRMLYNKTSLTEVEDTVAQIRQELDIVGTETKKPARKGRKRK